MTFLMHWVDPKDHILKVACQYLYYWLRYRLNKENRPIVIMPTHPKPTQEARVGHPILFHIVYNIDSIELGSPPNPSFFTRVTFHKGSPICENNARGGLISH